MITLFTFGPAFGLPDPSPFVTKAIVLLKMSGLEFTTDKTGFKKAPKGKLPYISDGGKIIADSTFIRMHLETAHGIEFDGALSEADRATAWAFEKLCEEHLYWIMMRDRWMDDDNFNAGPVRFFDSAPGIIRPLVAAMVRRGVRKKLHGQGIGRHSEAETASLARRDIEAISAFLAAKPFLMGAGPCGADAAIFAFIGGFLCDRFRGPGRDVAETRANLIAYRDRMVGRYFPETVAN